MSDTILPPSGQTKKFLAEALTALQPARALILDYYHRGVVSEKKSDSSPVTIADREAELLLRNHLLSKFPDHGFYGEEHGVVNPGSDYRWIVDPIDGTQSFIHRIPTFGTMIALEYKGESVVGVIDHPALGLCYSAALGCGATCNDVRMSIDDTTLAIDGWIDSGEVLCTTTRAAFAQSGLEERWDRLVQRSRLFRIYYDCFGLSRAVSGGAAAMIEMNVHTWDLAAVPVIVREAAGACYELPRWTDHKGAERRSMVFGKPSAAKRLFEFIQSGL